MRAIPRPTSDMILLGYSFVYIVVIVYNNIIDIVDGGTSLFYWCFVPGASFGVLGIFWW